MFRVVVGWLEWRGRRRAAIDVAIRYLQATTGERAHSVGSLAINEEDGVFVVRVCRGETRQPHRTWYRILAGDVVPQLTFEHVVR